MSTDSGSNLPKAQGSSMSGSGGGKGIYWVGAAILVIAGCSLAYFFTTHGKSMAESDVGKAPAAAMRVRTALAKDSPAERSLTIVGEAAPFLSTTIYAKISGYLDTISVDKGDRVKKDQLLATIKALEQVKDYDAAVADAKNKRGIAGRMVKLRQRALASDQETEQAVADADVAAAKVESLGVIKGYEVLRAPFEGQITGRYADPGALLQSAQQPVVSIATVDRLRVAIYVDQRWAPFVKVGDAASVWTLERPELKLKGTVSRLSGELDSRTKMLLAEVDLDNKEGQIVPGSFVQVALQFKTPTYVQIPTSALFTRKDKHFVSIVDSAGAVQFREIEPGDNDGTNLQVLNGLKAGERVALNLADSVAEGQHVEVIAE